MSRRRHQETGHHKKTEILIETVNDLYAFLVSLIYALLAEKKGGILGAVSAFVLNFPLAIVFGKNFGGFILEIPERPTNILGLIFALLPMIAGITLGFDGASVVTRNEIISVFAAAFMAFNMWSTRSFGSVAIWQSINDQVVKPCQSRSNKDEYYLQLLFQMIENYPGFRINVPAAAVSRGEINSDEVRFILNKLTKTEAEYFGQKLFRVGSSLKLGISTILFLGAVTTLPLWVTVAGKGWNHLHEGWGGVEALVDCTAVSHIAFYGRSAYNFLTRTLEEFYLPLLISMHNRHSNFSANLVRYTVTTLFFAGMLYLGWESGFSMGSEANGIDLDNVCGGVFSFLSDIYPQLIQFYAGVLVNVTAVASFFTYVLPKYDWYNRLTEAFSKLIGSADLEEEALPLFFEEKLVFKYELLALIRAGIKSELNKSIAVEARANLSGNPKCPELKYLGIFNLPLRDESEETDYIAVEKSTVNGHARFN